MYIIPAMTFHPNTLEHLFAFFLVLRIHSNYLPTTSVFARPGTPSKEEETTANASAATAAATTSIRRTTRQYSRRRIE